jgi:hypothetical protein
MVQGVMELSCCSWVWTYSPNSNLQSGVIKFLPCHDFPRTDVTGHTIGLGEGMQPEHTLACHLDHKTWRHVRQGKRVVHRSHELLDGADVPLDVSNMFVSSSRVEHHSLSSKGLANTGSIKLAIH